MISTFRAPLFLLLFGLAGLSLSSCSKKDAPTAQTQTSSSQQITTGSWRLDEIRQNGQVASSGTGIKDRYSLTFRADGTYTQKLLADNTTYNGTWALNNNNTVLHFTDQKGASTDYTLTSLKATELRYSFTNKSSQTEELVFSAQP
ncbi:lipocalin family protein [Hymenobacter sp. BT770]|uniref:lipocalin family protein n=1 Tax=Hymenobacter sp. BT770 TaxID=2886942 RepID=UPI001D11DCC0|nr:lipocalin family protein [Hymenobacter sp. BT770]MCC3153959.1 lipocalin family protein [Hymenobacter sp. BT770]MDO3416111.1 lipocalin family protein [Hymenobacter sp. BT770]